MKFFTVATLALSLAVVNTTPTPEANTFGIIGGNNYGNGGTYSGGLLGSILGSVFGTGYGGIGVGYGNANGGLIGNLLGAVFGNGCNNGGLLGAIFFGGYNDPRCNPRYIVIYKKDRNGSCNVSYNRGDGENAYLDITGLPKNQQSPKGILRIEGNRQYITQASGQYRLDPKSQYKITYY